MGSEENCCLDASKAKPLQLRIDAEGRLPTVPRVGLRLSRTAVAEPDGAVAEPDGGFKDSLEVEEESRRLVG